MLKNLQKWTKDHELKLTCLKFFLQVQSYQLHFLDLSLFKFSFFWYAFLPNSELEKSMYRYT